VNSTSICKVKKPAKFQLSKFFLARLIRSGRQSTMQRAATTRRSFSTFVIYHTMGRRDAAWLRMHASSSASFSPRLALRLFVLLSGLEEKGRTHADSLARYFSFDCFCTAGAFSSIEQSASFLGFLSGSLTPPLSRSICVSVFFSSPERAPAF
jgi:hypothetical protein